MIGYIKEHDNPVTSFAQKSKDDPQTLHNIISQEVMPLEIQDDLLKFDATCITRYETFQSEWFVTKQRSIFDTIHQKNLKTFKSKMAEKQTRQTKAKESKKQLAETQKIFDIVRVREYDIQELLTYDLIDTSYLFDAEGLMVKPNKSDLCNELEKMLEPTDYLQPSAWTLANTTAIVDVMAHLRCMRLANLNTFGDLCTDFLGYVHILSHSANRIDFVFDTYIDASVKDSERARRCNCSPIDLNDMSPETPLPVTMESFWASSINKAKLQLLLRKYVLNNPMAAADIVVSAIRLAEIEPARGVFSNIGITLPELNVKIEEADVRMSHMPCILSMEELQKSSYCQMIQMLWFLDFITGVSWKAMALRNCGSGLVSEILPGTYHFILWQRRWTQRSAKSYCHSITSLVVIHPANLVQKLLVWKQTLPNIYSN